MDFLTFLLSNIFTHILFLPAQYFKEILMFNLSNISTFSPDPISSLLFNQVSSSPPSLLPQSPDCFQQQGMNKHASRYLCLNPISCQIQPRFFCISKQVFILTTANYIFLFPLNLISTKCSCFNSNRTTIVNIASYDF